MIKAIRVSKNSNNEYNLQFLKEDKWHFFYDNEAIRKNVRKEVESWNIPSETEIIVLIGVGLGYHAVDLINLKLRGKPLKIILIEPIETIAQISNKLFNLKRSFNSSSLIHYIYGKEEEIQQKLLSSTKNFHAKLNKVKFLIPDIYLKFFSKEVKNIIEIIKSRIIENTIKLGNSIDDTILGIYNMFRNSQSISESLPLKIFKNYYNDLPVVIVSAGPSLNKNIHILKKYQDRVIIISTDATFRMLLQADIRVDFVTVLERDYITYDKFFKNIQYNKIPTLIYQSVVWPDIPISFKNSKAVAFKTLPTEKKFSKFIGEDYLSIPSGSSVATMSISLAHLMGAKEIILIGQDLAYSEEGYTHADGVSTKEKRDLRNAIEIDGINGKKVKSNITWRNFKLEIEDLIRMYSLNVIDATEGGALIKGTKVMNLCEILRSLPKITISYDFKKNKIDSKTILSKIEEYRDFLIQEIRDSINLLRKLQNINPFDWNEFLKIYSEIEKYSYFQHFHSSNSRLILYYHENNKDYRIYDLLQDMIESSNLLIDYIKKGFQLGKRYGYLFYKNADTLTGVFDKDRRNLNFFIENRMPFRALKLLNSIESYYSKEKEFIYESFVKLYSNFVIEKFYNPEKVIEYSLKLLSVNSNYINNNFIIGKIKESVSILLLKIITADSINNIEERIFNHSLNKLLRISININDYEAQCKILKYFKSNFESFEVLVAKYNCFLYKNKLSEAIELLNYMVTKYPNNSELLKELDKYKN